MPRIRHTTVLLATLAAFTLAGAITMHFANRRSALACVSEWARLNALPASATNVTIETAGSMFTRKFTVEFTAPSRT